MLTISKFIVQQHKVQKELDVLSIGGGFSLIKGCCWLFPHQVEQVLLFL